MGIDKRPGRPRRIGLSCERQLSLAGSGSGFSHALFGFTLPATGLLELRNDLQPRTMPLRPPRRELRKAAAGFCVAARSRTNPRQPDRKLRDGDPLFPGIIGYDDTVVPQLVNAILSRHNFILLGLRGQAKSRMLRALADLLDEAIPVVPGCEINDDPLAPLCAACRARVRAEGDALPIALARSRRPLRREARHARRHDRRHDRRPRSDQGRARGPPALRRADDALRAAAAREPRHLRHQRAARSRRQDPGRPVQHPSGRRRSDQGLPRAAAARRAMVFSANPEDYTARGRSSRRSRTASARRSARTTRRAARRRWPSRAGGVAERRGRRDRADRAGVRRARSSRRSRSRRARTRRSTSGPA